MRGLDDSGTNRPPDQYGLRQNVCGGFADVAAHCDDFPGLKFNAPGALADLENLATLRIWFEEEICMHMLKESWGDERDVLELEGMQGLSHIRGLREVVFEGHCPRLAAHFKPIMESPRLADGAGDGSGRHHEKPSNTAA